MTTVQIPLDRNPDVAALVADKQPGDKIFGCFTIKDNSEQTLTLRIEEFADSPDDLPKADEYDEDKEGDEPDDSAEEEKGEPDKSPEGKEAEPKPAAQPGSMGRKLASQMVSGDSSF